MRALGHRGHLRPYDVGIDRGLTYPRAEAAVASGDHVFPADKVGVTADALRDELGMLDEVRFRFDDARNEQLAVGQLESLEQFPLVSVAGVAASIAMALGRARNTISITSAKGTSQ